MKEVIINADDFGLKSSVNKAILESFQSGLITSTTILANQPGYEEAIEIAHKYNLVNRIGIHLNLTDGFPLKKDLLNNRLFLTDHQNLKKFKKDLFFLSRRDKDLIYNEFSAQIRKVKNDGININHIDTHHHIDEVWSIMQIILDLLKEFKIPSMRILNNLNRNTRFYKIAYRKMSNKVIKKAKSNYSDYFGNQFEAIAMIKNNPLELKNRILEIMVHPDISINGEVKDKINNSEYNFEYAEQLKNISFK